jgi:hypothetical protein
MHVHAKAQGRKGIAGALPEINFCLLLKWQGGAGDSLTLISVIVF